jgi:hypothetical protein
MDRWLDNLQKVTHPLAVPKPAEKVDEFVDLFRIAEHDGAAVLPQRMAKVFDDGAASGPDFVLDLINQRHGIPTSLVAEPHADGVFFEKGSDGDVWEHTYWGGVLVKSVVEGPKVGRMEFDGRGREVALSKGASLGNLSWDSPITASGSLEQQSDTGLLQKAAVSSRMFSLLTKIRQDCSPDEIARLEKAARALDPACFIEIAESVIARVKKAA